MKKFLILSIAGIVVIVALMVVIGYMNRKQAKSFSPEGEAVFKKDDLTIKVFYNRPYKKGREIFGDLVPYDEVWRTGANEATTFETNKDLTIEGKTLKAGKYSLWSIPGRGSWTIIFNSEYGQWGINSKAEANRDPARDVLSVNVLALQQDQEFEQFTISFEKTGEDAEMVLIWDKTLVAMPFSY
jgi:ABC-type antimicrobial peptide transport system permease subunit